MNQKKVAMLMMFFTSLSLFASEYLETEKIMDSVLLHNYENDCYVIYETRESIKALKENMDGTGEEYDLFPETKDIRPLSAIYEVSGSGIDSAVFAGETEGQKKVYIATTDFLTNDIYTDIIQTEKEIQIVSYELGSTRKPMLFILEDGELKQLEIDFRNDEYIKKDCIPGIEFTECFLEKKIEDDCFFGYGKIREGHGNKKIMFQMENDQYSIIDDSSDSPYRVISNNYNSSEIISYEGNKMTRVIFADNLDIQKKTLSLIEGMEKDDILKITKSFGNEINIYYRTGNRLFQKSIIEDAEREGIEMASFEGNPFIWINEEADTMVIQNEINGKTCNMIMCRDENTGSFEQSERKEVEKKNNIAGIKYVKNSERKENNPVIVEQNGTYIEMFSEGQETYDYMNDSNTVNDKTFTIYQKENDVKIEGWRF